MAGCQEIAGLLQGLADGDLPAGDRSTVEAHLSACDSCTREVERLTDNAAFLQEVLGPFQMPGEFPADFLLTLAPKGGKRRGPAAPSSAPRTVIMGETSDRRFRAGPLVGGVVLLGGAAALGWLFLGPEKTYEKKEWKPSTIPPVTARDRRGEGPADGRKPDGKPIPPAGGGKAAPPVAPPPAWEAMRTAADLLASLRAVKGEAFGAVVARGWDLLAGTPAEAAAVLEAAAAEKDGRLRAAMVLCLGADGREETRTALRGFLADEAAEVRGAAALGLARSLSFDNPAKRAVPAGPPLNMAVQVGALEEDAARAELSGRLGVESDEAVRRVLLLVLGPTAASDPAIRERILDGVKGAYGDGLRETCLKSLAGIQDPALVPAYAEALTAPGTPKSLHSPLIEGMLAADRNAAGEALAALVPSADGAEFRRTLVTAVDSAGGETARRVLLQVLSSDPEASIRLVAVHALPRYPNREVLDALTAAAANDADQMVRVDAEKGAEALRPIVEKMEGGGGNGGGDPPPPPVPEEPPQGDGSER